ncbi:MAG: thioredoxin family protein [Sphingomonadales bacterium]|nr:thioredoxin family protein [Sphingomonadales bacterium]
MKYIQKIVRGLLPNFFVSGLFICLLALLASVSSQIHAAPTTAANAQPQHFVEVDSLSFERPFWVAVVLPVNTGTHIPLNSSLHNESNWQLPAGFSIGQVLYPLPDSMSQDQQQASYSQTIRILYEIVPPAAYEVVPIVGLLPYAFQHSLSWSLCETFCTSQQFSYSFELYQGEGRIADGKGEIFRQARLTSLPPLPWPAEAYVDDSTYSLSIVASQADIGAHSVFIPTEKGFAGSIAKVVSYEAGVLTLSGSVVSVANDTNDSGNDAPYFSKISGVLASFDGLGGSDLHSGYRVFATNMKDEVITWSPKESTVQTNSSFLLALGLAFLGGLVLNLMPCVFPVLAMKAFQFAQSSLKTPSQMRKDGIAYTSGILLSFLLVATILILIRSFGGMVGWGFQLQSPIFVLALIWLMAAVALNFLGVYSLRFQALQNLANSKLLTRLFGSSDGATSFSTGVLATVVATPCTAPFMAPALGYALMQPPLVGLSIFLMLGFGLAFPYLVLSFVPAFATWLPKSGPWMVKLQRWLALPLALTVVWLVWVLAQQVTQFALLLGVASLGFLAFALYSKRKNIAVISILIGLVLVIYVGDQRQVQQQAVLPGIVDGLETVVWSPQAVEAYRGENRPIFVNVTAAWCITCLVHEKLVFSNDSFQAYMQENNIIYMVADWTNPDARIARLLDQHGRSGIPFYIFYPADPAQDVVLLPEVLTPASTIRILQENQ